MSSVSNDGSSRTKDTYSNQVDSLQEKHRQEMSELRRTYEEDLERVKAQASDEIDSFKSKTKEKLSDQDLKHQKDIETLKAVYQKKLEHALKKNSSHS